jgi:uncharacterized protein involved in tolerance to divalent cations
MEAYIQVVTTTAKRQDAEKIAKALVERRLEKELLRRS